MLNKIIYPQLKVIIKIKPDLECNGIGKNSLTIKARPGFFTKSKLTLSLIHFRREARDE
jgi:hypothetical protein